MPTKRAVLEQLSRDTLRALADAYEVEVEDRRVNQLLVDALASSRRATYEAILGQLSRDELKAICRAFDLSDKGRAKAEIVDRILGRDGTPESKPPPPKPPQPPKQVELPDEVAPPEDPPVIMTTPSTSSVLTVLTKSRLEDLGRQLGLVLPVDGKKVCVRPTAFMTRRPSSVTREGWRPDHYSSESTAWRKTSAARRC